MHFRSQALTRTALIAVSAKLLIGTSLAQPLPVAPMPAADTQARHQAMRWLERFLCTWEGEIIVISHDRSFCDEVSTHSALIYRSGIRKIEGNSEKLFSRIAEDEEIYERTRVSREKEIKRMESFINRFKAKDRPNNSSRPPGSSAPCMRSYRLSSAPSCGCTASWALIV
ncbi:MAG: hypothetical protein EBT41_01365 [Betaproteobacteria bacterium]|nr:hypothetical protein [Betaproteobacteria bacterium]